MKQKLDKMRTNESQRSMPDNENWYLNSIHCNAPSIDEILKTCLDAIWNKYDEDNSGYLDRAECKKFVMESIKDNQPDKNRKLTSLEMEKKAEEDEINDKQFEACF